jgi:hypothetical protein
MNLPVTPVNPAQVLIQLLSFLNQSTGLSSGVDGKILPASLMEASKLLFVPPQEKISFDSGLKIVPILHSFQKKLEIAADEAQAPRSSVKRGEAALPQRGEIGEKPPQTARPDPTLPSPKSRHGLTPDNPKPFESSSVKQLVKEVKEALRVVPAAASPREMTLVKAVAERLIPLLDRLVASLQLPQYQGKSKIPLNPPTSGASALGENPKKQIGREQSQEKQQTSLDLRRESVNQISRQIAKPNKDEGGKPETPSTAKAASEPNLSKTAPQTTLHSELKPHLRDIASFVAAPRAAGEPTPPRSAPESQTAPFAVPFFAQSPFSFSLSTKRKKKDDEEEKDQRENDEEEED